MTIERNRYINGKKIASLAAASFIGVSGACEHSFSNLNLNKDYELKKCEPVTLYSSEVEGHKDILRSSQELAPIWHLSREEEMHVFFSTLYNEEYNRAIFAYAAVYKDGDRGGNSLGISIGDYYRARFPGGLIDNLDFNYDSHINEIEMVYLGLERQLNDSWILKRVFLDRHGKVFSYDQNDFGCIEGSHVALFVDDGKHATYTSPDECNNESIINFMGMNIGTSSICVPIDAYKPVLDINGYLSSIETNADLKDAFLNLRQLEYQISEDFWTRCVIEDKDNCRGKLGFDKMTDLLDRRW